MSLHKTLLNVDNLIWQKDHEYEGVQSPQEIGKKT
jgi:hypothetical protein